MRSENELDGVAYLGILNWLCGVFHLLRVSPLPKAFEDPTIHPLLRRLRMTGESISQNPLILSGDQNFEDCLKNLAISLVVSVPDIDFIIDQCTHIANEKYRSTVLPENFSKEHLLAIIMLTSDLFALTDNPEENFFSHLNFILQCRDPDELGLWSGFLRTLESAINILPPVGKPGLFVFRGSKNTNIARNVYKSGEIFYWPGFTCATPDFSAAVRLAGKGGVVFRILTFSGRETAGLTAFDIQNEVVLPLNTRFEVMTENEEWVWCSDGEHWIVDIAEHQP